jgi:transmembrane sensor
MKNEMEENFELAKWLAGEMTADELKAFQQTPEYATYQKIADYSGQLEAPAFDDSKWYNTITSKPKKAKKVVQLHAAWWYKVAAIFVLFLGIALFYKSYLAVTEYTENGQQIAFSLPDDSKVLLNAGSVIDYKKMGWKNHRQLILTGEAYFRVAKGKTFEINTNLGKVTVVGTQFNVKSRGNRFDVTCYEGCVKVNYRNHEVFITHGKRIVFENGNAVVVPKPMTTQPEWTMGELAFANDNLAAIVKELERQYDYSIALQNSTTQQLFTGSLPLHNLDGALQILATTYHLKIKKIASQKIILEAIDVEK